jgi:carbon storage regulator CsrA
LRNCKANKYYERKPNTNSTSRLIKIGEDVAFHVTDVCGKKVRLGISAPHGVPIIRRELNSHVPRKSEQRPQEPTYSR